MPNRILKESICTSDKISQCSWFEEVLFYRLIVNCDDFGRFDGRTAVIKSRLFPLADSLTLKSVDDAVKKLVSIGLVSCYEANGKPFLFLPTWNEHQNIRAKKSKYPDPENICKQMISDDCKCPRNPIRIQSESESNPKPETRTRATAAAVYLDRVNASASQTCLEQLAAYEREMGAEVCIRAMDIALDNKKATWAYIRGILSKWQSLGVKCLADIDRFDHKPEKAARTPSAGKARSYYDADGMNESLRRDMEWLEKFAEGDA